MSFKLKNVDATFQCVMSIIFCNHPQKIMECYVDDITVKSHNRSNLLDDLRTMLDIVRACHLKINSTKSFLGVLSDKFLGFIIASIGIHFDPDKVKEIQGMQPPVPSKSLKVYKAGSPISKDSLQFSWTVANCLHG